MESGWYRKTRLSPAGIFRDIEVCMITPQPPTWGAKKK
jgi:hypothetical protein